MSIVLRSDFENVKAQLEDTQESLAAAFARIEVFRQREKILLAEVSRLRTAQAVAAVSTAEQTGQVQQDAGDSTSPVASSTVAASGQQQHTEQQSLAADGDARAATSTQQDTQQQQQQQDRQQDEASPAVPCYITDVAGHLPVMLLSSSGRRTPGSIVVTHDYVDFVEVRARIKRDAFIGITASSLRGHSASKQGSSGLKLKHLLPSCISSRDVQPGSPPAPARNSKRPGMAHQVPAPDTSTASASPAAWFAAAAAETDMQPEAASSSSMSWQQQLHYQDLSAPLTSPQRARRSSAGGVTSPTSSKPTEPEAVLSPKPETPSGWAAAHSLRHCATWHSGHSTGDSAPAADAGGRIGGGHLTETELAQLSAAAAAGSGGGGGSPRGSSGSSSSLEEGSKGVWKILWRGGGMQQQLVFEATHTTREVLHKHTLRWLGDTTTESDELGSLAAAAAAAGSGDADGNSSAAIAADVTAAAAAAGPEGGVEMAVPKHLNPALNPAGHLPRLSEPSGIIQSSSSSSTAGRASNGSIGAYGGLSSSPVIGGINIGIHTTTSSSSGGRPLSPSAAVAAAAAGGGSSRAQLVPGLAHLTAALPPRYQSRDWTLLYSTARHGISLQTLYRKASGVSASVLLLRDTNGYVFGAFCSEAWRPSPRFFGTGETFVFQLAPHKVMWPWKLGSPLKNDFFMYAQQDSLGVGGLGAFAIWLDGELLHGSSGRCGTFGSPCLASREEFKVAALELWGLA